MYYIIFFPQSQYCGKNPYVFCVTKSENFRLARVLKTVNAKLKNAILEVHLVV
jgi:hypothetical protein